MAKRDYTAEIAAKRSRLKRRAERWEQMSQRIDTLIDIATAVGDRRFKTATFRNEVAKYVPIGWVACVEGYFRLAIRDLVDHGDPFRTNAARFKDIRVSIEHVVAMQGGRMTLGEFISHLLPTNSVDDISSSMSVVLGEPFLDAIKTVETDFFKDNELVSLEATGLFGDVLLDTQKLFEQRHIFAHELAPRAKVNVPNLRTYSRASLIFMWAAEAVVTGRLARAA